MMFLFSRAFFFFFFFFFFYSAVAGGTLHFYSFFSVNDLAGIEILV